jgi:two-component system chemotaxis response regulator CheB
MPETARAASVLAQRKIRVLVIDDSAVVRKILSSTIDAESDLEVVGTAPDAYVARDMILALRPDVLTLDIEMPRMSGLTFLRKLMHFHPMPVIMISSLGLASADETLEALRCGAVDVLAKPAGPCSVGDLRFELAARLRAAAQAHVRPILHDVGTAYVPAVPVKFASERLGKPRFDSRKVIAIGASTGGTSAIQEVLTHLPADAPGIVIAQHIPPVFSLAFARRLDQLCPFEVREAVDGDEVLPGRVLIAPGNFHMLLRRSPGGYRVEVRGGPQVCYQRPSVDVLFASVAEAAGDRAIGVLLTGMGSDGAQGMLAMMNAGAITLAQDEESSVVYGMPREALRLGGVGHVAALQDIPSAIVRSLHAPLRRDSA